MPLQQSVAAITCAEASQPVLLGWLEDNSQALSLEQVHALPSDAWHGAADTFPDFTNAAVWLRLRLDNHDRQDCFYWLTLGSSRLESMQVYLPQGDRWERLQAGSLHPPSEWPSASRHPRFPVQLAANQQMDILVRISTRSRFYVAPGLWSQHSLYASEQQQQLLDGLALLHKVQLSWLAWAFGSFMTLQGTSLVLSGAFYAPISYGEDHLAVTSNVPMIFLLISTLIVTSQQHRRQELHLKQRVQRLQENAREKLKRTVDQRTRQLQESLTANQNLIARISHDLRAPLGHIITHAQRLEPETATEEARRIGHYAQRQLELLNDLIAFAVGDMQQQTLSPEAGYFYAFIHDIEREGELLTGRNYNRFHVDLGNDLPPLLQADFRALRRILINLLDNASKYTQQGRVCMSIQCLGQDTRQATLHFSVEDTGPGLAPELRQRILQPLQRGNNQAVAGFGLGLTIVAELLAQMQSELEIHQP
ncbi:MAG: 7TM-DISM domain-containing protein [Marinobacterium sp.]